MASDHSRLIAAAQAARRHSYSPYSGFRVGAALLTAGGKVYTGTNVENASFSLSICAERVALFQAVTAGEREFVAIAIATDTVSPTPPCGACRQVLQEFAPEIRVLLAGQRDMFEEYRLSDLLARPFSSFPGAQMPE
jgi:cytidine deaminase